MRDLMKDRVKNEIFIEVPEFHINDYVQVVRCKDCKYNDENECIIKAGWFPVKPDWFCADGERESDNG